jgi:aerobic-type carbon monoxide dehydrogenase small subunit (CoxS/CutS family)
VVTVEGLADGPRPSPLQEAFDLTGAAQCGFCTPGILCTASQLLSDNPSPTRAEIARALSGNLCRCTGYTKILEAVEVASEAGRSGRSAADVLAARRSAGPEASPLVEGNR